MQRLRFVLIFAVLVIALALQTIPVQATRVVGAWTRIYEGVEYATGSDDAGHLQRAFAMRISLKNPDVVLYASHSNGTAPMEVTNQTNPTFLVEHGCKVAVNASYCSVTDPYADVWGLTISDGTIVSTGDYGAPYDVQLRFDAAKVGSIVQTLTTPGGMWTAVSGNAYHLVNGVCLGADADLQPRTSAGISQDGKYLIWVCVDGRQSGWSDGATVLNMSHWQQDWGAYNALNLDGGGSTIMTRSNDAGGYIILNSPCYGYARSNGVHLGARSVVGGSGGPDSVSKTSSRIDIVARGAGNTVAWKNWVSGVGWSSWQNIPGATTYYNPAICSWASNRLDVFHRGTSNWIYQATWNGSSWSGWTNLGGGTVYGPAAVSQGTNLIDMFIVSTDYRMYQKKYVNGTWDSVWTNLEGVWTSNPAVCSWAQGRLDLFCRGLSNDILQRTCTNGVWSGSWTSVGGTSASAPAACCWASGRIDLIYRGTDNRLWAKWFSGGVWSPSQTGWNYLGYPGGSVYVAGDPAINTRGSGMLDVYVRGTDDHLWQKSYASGVWGSWIDLGPFYN